MLTEGQRTDIASLLRGISQAFDERSRTSPETLPLEILERLRSTAEVVRQEAANLEEPFRLGIVGMFKSGKSSVINSFLQRKVLQEGRTEATAVLTELRFAVQPGDEKAVALYRDGRTQEMTVARGLDLTDIRSVEYSALPEDERRLKQEELQRIILHLHVDILRTVNLLDTPGFGGSEVGDVKAFEALGRVDAALMVFSADRTGAEHEILIADELARAKRDVVALLNKIDDGHGGMLSEAELSGPEEFLRRYFLTLVKGRSGQRLIFRFSATEVWKALDALKRPQATEEERRSAVSALARWGYYARDDEEGNREPELRRGVVNFIRERYFSNTSEAVERKVKASCGHVSDLLTALAQELDKERLNGEKREAESRSRDSEVLTQQEYELAGKVEGLEQEIERLISDCLQPFTTEIEEAMVSVVQKRSTIELLLQLFRPQDEIANRMQKEFQEAFPDWRMQDFADDVRRRILSLLRREWKMILRDLHEIHSQMGLPDLTGLLDEAQAAVKKFAIGLGAYLAGTLVLSFIPGGQILQILLLLTQGFTLYHAKKAEGAVEGVRAKIHVQVKNMAVKIKLQMKADALKINDELADRAREAMTAKLEEAGGEEVALHECVAWLQRTSRDVESALESVGEIQLTPPMTEPVLP